MRRWVGFALVACLALAGGWFLWPRANAAVRPIPSDERVRAAMPVVNASNAFGLRLLEVLAKAGDKPNLLISPLSLQLCSALLLESAKGSGRDEMKAALGLGAVSDQELGELVRTLTDALLSDPHQPVQVANAIWLTRPIPVDQAFADRIEELYDGEIGTSKGPDEALAAINAWADKNTGGQIPKILDTVSPDETVLLLNAIAFKARWQHEFKPSMTQPMVFTTLAGAEVTTPLMYGYLKTLESQEEEFAAVRMDYLGGTSSMVAFLPREGTTPLQVLQVIRKRGFAEVLKTFHRTEVSVLFPKFRWEDDHELKDTYQALGVRKVFERLDLSPLGAQLAKGLILKQVVQKAVIEVDEQGTRAAAVTAGTVAPSAPMDLHFVRAFLYAIVHNKTGAILFLGICGDPTMPK